MVIASTTNGMKRRFIFLAPSPCDFLTKRVVNLIPESPISIHDYSWGELFHYIRITLVLSTARKQ